MSALPDYKSIFRLRRLRQKRRLFFHWFAVAFFLLLFLPSRFSPLSRSFRMVRSSCLMMAGNGSDTLSSIGILCSSMSECVRAVAPETHWHIHARSGPGIVRRATSTSKWTPPFLTEFDFVQFEEEHVSVRISRCHTLFLWFKKEVEPLSQENKRGIYKEGLSCLALWESFWNIMSWEFPERLQLCILFPDVSQSLYIN